MAACINGQVILEEKYERYCEFTKTEITDYANWLGVNLEQEPDLYPIIYEGIRAPLPKDWKPCMNTDGDIYYFNFTTGQSIWEHPCDVYYRNIVLEYKRKKRDVNSNSGTRRLLKIPQYQTTFNPAGDLKLLRIEKYSQPTRIRISNDDLTTVSHSHDQELSEEGMIPRNLNKTRLLIIRERKPLKKSQRYPENNKNSLRDSRCPQQAMLNKTIPEYNKTLLSLPLVDQVDADLLDSPYLSNSDDFMKTNTVRQHSTNKSQDITETLEEETQSNQCSKVINYSKLFKQYPIDKQMEKFKSTAVVSNTDKNEIDTLSNKQLHNTSSACVTQLLDKMDKHHKEVLGANERLCCMQKELVNWCNEIEKHLYDIDNQNKILIRKEKDSTLRINNASYISSVQQTDQLTKRDNSLPNPLSFNTYPSNITLCGAHNLQLSTNHSRKRPHSCDDYFLMKDNQNDTLSKKTVGTNNMLVRRNQNESPLDITDTQFHSQIKHLSRFDKFKMQYPFVDDLKYQSKHENISLEIRNHVNLNLPPTDDKITLKKLKENLPDNKQRSTFIDWEKLSSNLAKIRSESYGHKSQGLDKNISQHTINRHLEDYTKWLKTAEAYMRILQSNELIC
ncbi:unnamed protein product [Trichobilharzia regenti]|uniref:WW domain-containing protein n=1 Tax=Trichobilharzia regenti TaxID=157069 RepID=A0A183X264_TRIRE|nr:unnamed protein product [Trichobilharzia regenti]VDQ14345.1 unnamed protein product [Trichobilharzia regenti]